MHTNMEHWRCQFNVAKVPWTFLLALFARLAIELPLERAESGIVGTLSTRALPLLILQRG